MDFLNFADISFLPNSSIGRLCKDLSNNVGQGIWYDTFQVQNTKWLWLVKYIVTILNSDVFCGSFGLYPSYVAGILNSVKEIHFYVLCIKQIYYADYIEKRIAGKKCTVSYKSQRGCYFHLSCSGNTVII